MSHRYEFATTSGRSCCKSNDIEYLCDHCKAAAASQADALGRRLQGYGSVVFDAAPEPYAPALRAAADRAHRAHRDDDKRLEEMRAARQHVLDTLRVSARAAAAPATSKVHLEPPCGYDIAIAAARSAKRGNV